MSNSKINEGKAKHSDQVISQASKLERYINQYPTRSCNVSNALGVRGTKMLNDLLILIDAQESSND